MSLRDPTPFGQSVFGKFTVFISKLAIFLCGGIDATLFYSEPPNIAFQDLVSRGAEERQELMLMTALATGLAMGLALLPIVVGGNKPGDEIEHPLAVVILGGLAPSTILNLFLMPALYLQLGKSSDAVSDSAR